jgi:hypothetical protein
MVRHFCILSIYSSLDDEIDNDNSDSAESSLSFKLIDLVRFPI